jgi:hypothetical protein
MPFPDLQALFEGPVLFPVRSDLIADAGEVKLLIFLVFAFHAALRLQVFKNEAQR